jgi:hypothetical protein
MVLHHSTQEKHGLGDLAAMDSQLNATLLCFCYLVKVEICQFSVCGSFLLVVCHSFQQTMT